MTNLKTIVLAAFSLVLFTNITKAQAVNPGYTVNAPEPLSVKYLGEDGNYLFFKVTLRSDEPKKASFAIEDKNEGPLYSSGLKEISKATTIKIEKTEPGQTLNFKLVNGKKTYIKSFSVNTNLVETTTVSEGDITRL